MAIKYWVSTSSTSFNTAGNWSDAAAPVTGDTLIFNGQGTANCSTNLPSDYTAAYTIIKEKSYAGQIGVLTGSTATYFKNGAATLFLERDTGSGEGSGSPLLMFDFSTFAGVVNVYDSSSTSASTYYPPILLKGTNLTLNQGGGQVGLAVLPNETATGTFRIYTGDGSVAPELYLGAGTTITALSANGGTIINRSDNTCTAATLEGNSVYTYDGTGAHTTLNVYEPATCNYRGTGTITTLNQSGVFDRSKDTRAMTITNWNIYKGANINLDNGSSGSVTRTNAPAFVGCAVQDVEISMPVGERF